MADYYLYRINPKFDGFTPDQIGRRAPRRKFVFNWGAYLENVERGDIILIYFTGYRCTTGIYGVAVVRDVSFGQQEKNVSARLLSASENNRDPLIPLKGNERFFKKIRTRPRGAEVVVPEKFEPDVFEALKEIEGLLEEAKKHNVSLPGEEPYEVDIVSEVPIINLQNDFQHRLHRRGVVAAFWVRPSRTNWIKTPPEWLRYFTSVFSKFKAGDISYIDEFAKIIANQLTSIYHEPAEKFGAIVSVPLNQSKLAGGEIDRVRYLAEALSTKINVPYYPVFRLDGNVSRQLYKSWGYSDEDFRKDYLENLTLKRNYQRTLRDRIKAGYDIILIDDVFTNGLTTSTVEEALRGIFSDLEFDVQVVTLGVMTIRANVGEALQISWS